MGDHLDELLSDLQSSDGMARKRARETLVLVGDPAAPRLRELVESADKRTRWEAAKTLGEAVDFGSLETFVTLLGHQDSDLRWLAATGLIKLGPRSIRPVLQSLADPSIPRGHREMGHRVLAELAKDNEVVAPLVAPVLRALDGDDAGVTAATAARALSDLDKVTGRPA